MISIREAEERDAEACSRVLCASIHELCVADHHGDADVVARWTANKTPERMARWIADPRATLFLAEHDGAPAGVGGGVSENGEILLNYVAPLYRFRGVSRAMLTTWSKRCVSGVCARHGLRARKRHTASIAAQVGWISVIPKCCSVSEAILW